ncbi:MAG: hypothetical protein SGJ24_11995 [Chloroflexota bacterium]|nr:hypothetical protein [Chloroflexota bacterium]
MSALEREVIEKFQQLDDEAQQRVGVLIAQQTEARTPSSGADRWLDGARALRAEMRARYGKLTFSAAMLVNEVREERLNELMDRY